MMVKEIVKKGKVKDQSLVNNGAGEETRLSIITTGLLFVQGDEKDEEESELYSI